MTPDALAALKSRIDRDLKTASPNHALHLGPAAYDGFARQGWLIDRVFRTAHPPIVTAIFPTYEDRAVHRDASVAGEGYALGRKAVSSV